MNEMLIGLVIIQFVVMAYTAGWVMGNKPTKQLREDVRELDDYIDNLKLENKELSLKNKELNFENESLHNNLNRRDEPKMEKPSDPMEALLLKMIEETDSQDKTHLEQVRKAWNFQPKPSRLIKREEGDS